MSLKANNLWYEQTKRLKHEHYLCEVDNCGENADFEGIAYEIEDRQPYTFHVFVCEKHLDNFPEYVFEPI